jgi:hypothetical protein
MKERISNKELEVKEEINKKFEKIKAVAENEKYELLKILTKELSFENLSIGIQIVEEDRKGKIPLYQMLRNKLPVYGDR